MSAVKESILKKGYIPLACNSFGGISWMGTALDNFWMWNRQYTEYEGGVKYVQTIKVDELGEAALRYWKDKWVPVLPVDEGLLRRMEDSLRADRSLMSSGVSFPSDDFLDLPDKIPVVNMGPEVRELLGLEKVKGLELLNKRALPDQVIESYKRTKG